MIGPRPSRVMIPFISPTVVGFLDNLDSLLGGSLHGLADTGQARTQVNGNLVLSGTGYVYLSPASPDIALLQWTGLTVPDGSTFKVTLSTFEGDSPIVFFNHNFDSELYTGEGWGVHINDDNDQVVLYDYSSIIYPSTGARELLLNIPAGISPSEEVEVTVVLSGDSITISAKGESDTLTVGGLGGRPYKNQSGFGVLFQSYNTNRRLYKAEVIA